MTESGSNPALPTQDCFFLTSTCDRAPSLAELETGNVVQ